MTGEEIIKVVDILIGEIDAYGSEHIDKERYENQQKLKEVAWHLIDRIYGNTMYVGRVEHSMFLIGNDACEFLEDLAETYRLGDFVGYRDGGQAD